jgi:hypothetical protein
VSIIDALDQITPKWTHLERKLAILFLSRAFYQNSFIAFPFFALRFAGLWGLFHPE